MNRDDAEKEKLESVKAERIITNIYHSPLENRSTMRITFQDSYVAHSWDFYVHECFSIQTVKEILETALLTANRKADRDEIGQL